MPIDNYSGWFGEAVNDPHTDFSLVLHTYRPDADNAATLAELNATWAEDDDPNPLPVRRDAYHGHDQYPDLPVHG